MAAAQLKLVLVCKLTVRGPNLDIFGDEQFSELFGFHTSFDSLCVTAADVQLAQGFVNTVLMSGMAQKLNLTFTSTIVGEVIDVVVCASYSELIN